MKHPSFYILSALTLAAFGCSQQSKQEYHQAAQNLTHAAKETGKAVTTDVKTGAQAAKNASEAAKNTVKAKQDEHGSKDGSGTETKTTNSGHSTTTTTVHH